MVAFRNLGCAAIGFQLQLCYSVPGSLTEQIQDWNEILVFSILKIIARSRGRLRSTIV